MIICDSREPTDKFEDYYYKWIAEINNEKKIPGYDIKKLEYGDYLLNTNNINMIIERKEYHDYIGSIGEDLKLRLENMRQQHNFTMLLIEGSPIKYTAKNVFRNSHIGLIESKPYAAYRNFMLSQGLNGTIIMHTIDYKETVLAIINMHNYISNKKINKKQMNLNDGSTWLSILPCLTKNKVLKLKKEYDNCYEALTCITEWADQETIDMLFRKW